MHSTRKWLTVFLFLLVFLLLIVVVIVIRIITATLALGALQIASPLLVSRDCECNKQTLPFLLDFLAPFLLSPASVAKQDAEQKHCATDERFTK